MITRKEYIKSLEIVEKYQEQTKADITMPSWREFKPRRIKLGLSMQDVSDIVGCSKATISRLECGREVLYNTVKSISNFYTKNGY